MAKANLTLGKALEIARVMEAVDQQMATLSVATERRGYTASSIVSRCMLSGEVDRIPPSPGGDMSRRIGVTRENEVKRVIAVEVKVTSVLTQIAQHEAMRIKSSFSQLSYMLA